MSSQAELQETEALGSEPQKVILDSRATIGDKGRLVIPAAIREALEIQPGDELDLHFENHELRITSRWSRLRRAQERAQKLVQPGRSIVDEFLAERRAEALAELED